MVGASPLISQAGFLGSEMVQASRALGGLAQKYNLQPKTPLLRRLLELAENPPQPGSSARWR